MTLELAQSVAPEVAALKDFYEKKGQLKAYVKEFRMARNVTEEKLQAMPSRFIPKMCKALDGAGIPAFDARRIVEADALSLGWSKWAVFKALPRHYKNPVKVKAGEAAATLRAADAGRNPATPRGLAAANQSVRDRVARSGGVARAQDRQGMADAGKKGGEAVKQQYGESYFREIGIKAHEGGEKPAVEQLLTGEFQVNPLEWKEHVCETMEQARAEGRNVVFMLRDSKLVTVRLAGVATN